MSIVLFAIIGAKLRIGAAYWICFALYCLFRVFNEITKNDWKDNDDGSGQ